MTRTAAIIIGDGLVALVERRRAGELYYLFPGGAVEEGETIEEATRREVEEELGLEVDLGDLVADVTYRGRRQLYFLASVRGGVFGSGSGPEYENPRADDLYTPVWLPLDELLLRSVYPRAVAQLVVAAATTGGWPRDVLRVEDPGRQAQSPSTSSGRSPSTRRGAVADLIDPPPQRARRRPT